MEPSVANPIHLWIAQLAHEVNRGYCESLGDTSQKPWHEAPQWQKDSCLNGVIFVLDHENAGAEASHENWLKEKLADGWKYGPEKNVEAKEHPCCVPFANLPMAQQAKDHIFRAVVINAARGIMAIAGVEQMKDDPPDTPVDGGGDGGG